MARSAPRLRLDDQLCFALYRASRAAIRSYGPALDQLGLTYPQYLTMLVLWEADGPLSVGAIGARLQLDSGTLTPLLKRLQDLGLVSRTRDPADERRVLVALTAAGSRLHRRAGDVPAQVFARSGIDVAAGRELLERLTTLAERLEESERSPT